MSDQVFTFPLSWQKVAEFKDQVLVTLPQNLTTKIYAFKSTFRLAFFLILFSGVDWVQPGKQT